ncbi:BCCT family transporter [Shouchella sp. 1P09AA]|uniref:BCCT family transporter n=1 Tax=unclassified Shouchella TaxID=2893065 RepID=UPI0039A3AFE2
MKTKKIGNRVLMISAAIMIAFVLWGVISPISLGAVADDALQWVTEYFGWFYMLVLSVFIVFALIVMVSPFGRMRLGKDDDEPQYKFITWIGMLFSAGIGVGFVFFGVAEPVLNYLDPPPNEAVQNPEAAAAVGLRYAVYHWGLHCWIASLIVGLIMSYVMYRKNKPALISSAFYPLLRNKTDGVIGKSIDIFAILATCAGVATTFGLSALQISGGLSYITPIPNTVWTQITLIIIVTICFIFSALSGIDKGIKRLTNINIAFAGILLIFVISFGPTIFIFESMVTTLGSYVGNVVQMSLTLEPYAGSNWIAGNTIFFWGWHMSWAPFIGLFVARISKGRSIREFIAGVLFVPAALALIWFSSFGGSSLYYEVSQGISTITSVSQTNEELAMFVLLEQLPLSLLTSIVALLLIFIFFITSADSATFILGSMTSNGMQNPPTKLKLLWGILIGAVAAVLLLSGGDDGLSALQTAAITGGLPIAFILIGMVVCLTILLTRDYRYYRRQVLATRSASLKDEIREDFYEEWKDEVSEEIKDDFKDQAYQELKEELREDVYKELKEDLKEDVKKQLKKENRKDL